jgi:O-Antigen ligase/Tetratricopeptide repeat
MLATVVTAVVVFWLAYDDATFGLVARSSLAIVLWWAIAIGSAVGALALAGRRSFWGTGALLVALAAWTAASIGWATSDERAFNELNRVSLYVATFTLAGLLARRAAPERWADGVALGVVGIGIVALAHRFFPDAFPRGELGGYAGGPQLSYPVEYVNGLAILIAVSLPLVLRSAVSSRTVLGRAAALAPFPALSAALYLTSSRGGAIVAATGVVVFFALTEARWATAGALATAIAGSAGAVAVLVGRPELVDEPLSRAAENQGPEAAVLVTLLCLGTALVYAGGERLVGGRTPTRAFGWATAAVALVLAIVGIAAADPVEKFETFRKAPTEAGARDPEYTVRGHLLSSNSTGRWQFWKSAAGQFEEHPVVGNGAGSYEAWWARHGSFAMFITDAHSLYLETLGELGIIGFVFLIAAIGLGGIAAVMRTRTATHRTRSGYAALTACVVAYAVGAAVDWMWEFTVVSVVAFAALGWAVGGNGSGPSGIPRLALRTGLPLLAVLAIVALAIPLLATLEIRDSQAAVRDNDLGEAIEQARAARDIQPWAASPHLQLALVLEQAGEIEEASRAIREAVKRDPGDWRLWLVRARLETKLGSIQTARRSLRRAMELNPRSPIFATG